MLLLFALLLFYKQAINQVKSTKNKLLIAGVVGYAIISFFSFPAERIIHLFLFIILISLFIDYQSIDKKPVYKINRLKPIILLGLAFSILVGFYQVYGQYQTRRMLESKIIADFHGMIKHAEAALSPFYLTDPTSTPIASYLGFAHYNLGNHSEAFNSSKEAYELAPYDFEILSNYGSQLMNSGDYAKANAILNEAYRINIYNDEIKLNLVVLNYNQKNFWQAYLWIQEIPNYEQKQSEMLTKIIEKLSFEN